MNCYNCGVPLTRKDSEVILDGENKILKYTREHIPAKCYFDDATDDQKQNRLTVPACSNCNNQFASIDDELRNVIGIQNDSLTEGGNTTEKALRSVMRSSDWHTRLRLEEETNKPGFIFNRKIIYDTYKKNFKGLYYYKYGQPLGENWDIAMLYNGFGIVEDPAAKYSKKEISHVLDFLKDQIKTNGNLTSSGHNSIFEFSILLLGGTVNPVPVDKLTDAKIIAMLQNYHNKVPVYLMAVPIK